jgi:NADPH:quinone reductase-like Zn-dependent oxidoreductase
VLSAVEHRIFKLTVKAQGGKETTTMLKFIGEDGHLVSYGAMSKKPLSLPTSAFIFKNLIAHGFWQSQWYLDRSIAEREKLMQSLTQLIKEAKVSFRHNMFRV